jgi:hypothetical protein
MPRVSQKPNVSISHKGLDSAYTCLMTDLEPENQQEQAVEQLLALAKSFAARGGSISHEEFKEWINTGRP